MISWETYKRACLEYSLLAPKFVVTTFTPTAAVRAQAVPADALEVLYLDYGQRVSLKEAQTDESGELGWAFEAGSLYLTPAPSATTPLSLHYYGYYVPNDNAQTVAGIPAVHQQFVDDLELAIVLTGANYQTLLGPLNYTVGQTQINRSQGPKEMRELALQLRARAETKLAQPFGLPG